MFKTVLALLFATVMMTSLPLGMAAYAQHGHGGGGGGGFHGGGGGGFHGGGGGWHGGGGGWHGGGWGPGAALGLGLGALGAYGVYNYGYTQPGCYWAYNPYGQQYWYCP